MQEISGAVITSMVALAADAKNRSDVVSKNMAVLAQAHIELQAENVRLRAVLALLVQSDAGKQTLDRLAEGQGTDTDDGRAWLHAAGMAKAAAPATNEAAPRKPGRDAHAIMAEFCAP